jgi:hypothetical protein
MYEARSSLQRINTIKLTNNNFFVMKDILQSLQFLKLEKKIFNLKLY